MSMNHRCFFILDRIVWPLTTFTDRPENSFRSSAFQRLFSRSSGFKICQPMLKRSMEFCLTAWAFLPKMDGLTSKGECSSSSPLRMSRGLCVAQTTKRWSCSGNLKNLVWLNENAEDWASQVWYMWKTFRQTFQMSVSRIVKITNLGLSKKNVKTHPNHDVIRIKRIRQSGIIRILSSPMKWMRWIIVNCSKNIFHILWR